MPYVEPEESKSWRGHVTIARVAFWACMITAVVFAVLAYVGNQNTQQDTQKVACASATFASDVGGQFRGALERAKARVGTPDELSTDQASVKGTQPVLDALDQLAATVNPICGAGTVKAPSQRTDGPN